jgi:hypothetical protein
MAADFRRPPSGSSGCIQGWSAILLDERRREMTVSIIFLVGFGAVWLTVLLAAGVAASLTRLKNLRA